MGESGLAVAGPSIALADQTLSVASGPLVAINTAAPSQRVTLEAAGQWHSMQSKNMGKVLQGTIDGTGALTGLRQRYMVYLKGSRLMKADLSPATGAPAGALWTTLQASNICGGSYLFFNTATDYADPTKSYVFFVSPNAAGQCGGLGTDLRPNAVYRALRMDMGPNDAPLTVPNPLAPIHDATGRITGFIVRAGDRIQRTDANFANAVDLFAAPVGLITLAVFGSTPPGVWLFTDSTDVYAVDLANPTSATPLQMALNLALANRQAIAADGASLYIAYGPRLFRIDQNRTASLLTTAAQPIDEVAFTNSRVVFRTTNNALQSVPKSGGNITPLATSIGLGATDYMVGIDRNGAIDPLTGSSSFLVHSFFTGGDNVYWAPINGTGTSTYSVRAINADGTNPLTISGARVVSWTEAPAVAWTGNAPVHTLYVVEGENTSLFAGAQINAYDAATRARRFVLGNFPAALTLTTLTDPTDPIQFGQSGLLRALMASTTGTLAYNLFLFKSDTNGLTQVTP